MNPTTPDTRTAGQIAFEAFFPNNGHNPTWAGDGDKNYSERWQRAAQAVIASLPRAGVRVLSVEEVLPLFNTALVHSIRLNSARHIADGINALLQTAPPPEPPKPEQEWEERTGVHAKHEGWKRSECQFRWKHSEPWETIRTENDPQDEDGFYPTCFYRRPRQPKQEREEREERETPECDKFASTPKGISPVDLIGKWADFARTLERSCDALRLQLTNAMVERDQMNAERDAALERVEATDQWVVRLAMLLQVEGGTDAGDGIYKAVAKLTASQAELAQVDLALGNVSAFDDCKTRYDKVCKAMATAKQADDLTAKLKAAEETRVEQMEYYEKLADEHAATISRLEGEIDQERLYSGKADVVIQNHWAEIQRLQKELASMKSQPCGSLTVEMLKEEMGDSAEKKFDLKLMAEHLNSHLAPSWTPISTPPTEADADRNGNVEFLVSETGLMYPCGWKGGRGNFTHWRHTNLPAQSVQDDGFARIMRKTHPDILPGSRGWELHQVTWNAALATKGTTP